MKYTKDQLLQYLESNNEEKLREASHYFLTISGQYRRLLQYQTNILMYPYLVVPRFFDSKILSTNKFKKDFQSVLKYTDDAYLEETNRYITAITLVDGVFYGYERVLDDVITVQQLPPKYCRSLYKINGNYAVEFNLKFFDIYKDPDLKIQLFEMFPDEFLKMYLDYKDGKTTEWVQLNPTYARCHKFTDTLRPLLADIFTDLLDFKEYMEMDKVQSKMDLYKLIVQKIPVDKETGEPIIELEESRELHKNAKKMITQEGIDVLTTPLDVEAINLQERGSTVRDHLDRANNSIYNTAGTPRMIFNSKDGGSIGLNASLKTDEAMMFILLDQFKRWYDNRLKLFSKSKDYWFEIIFPKISIFNWKEMAEFYQNSATYGYSKLMPIVATGIKQTTYMNMLDFENEFLNLGERMKPLQSSHTQSNGKSGRPKMDDSELSDEGRKTRETEANDNRAKM